MWILIMYVSFDMHPEVPVCAYSCDIWKPRGPPFRNLVSCELYAPCLVLTPTTYSFTMLSSTLRAVN